MLSEVYPNPFNPRAAFTLTLAEPQQTTIAVYDVHGRRVAVLHEGHLAAGTPHRFTLTGGPFPSGAYLLRATGETFTATRTAVLLKHQQGFRYREIAEMLNMAEGTAKTTVHRGVAILRERLEEWFDA